MEDAADTAICMVVVSVCLECQRKKCLGAVPDVSVSPRTTAEMLMLFDTCFCARSVSKTPSWKGLQLGLVIVVSVPVVASVCARCIG
jgi:hypothetical protein